MNQECLFCKIISGDIPSYKIYEDDDCYAFLDIYPINYGHTLVVPKEHVVTMDDINEETFLKVLRVAKKIAPVLERELNCDGITYVQNNGFYQDVKHFHLHIVPRYEADLQLTRNNRPNDEKTHLDVLSRITKKLNQS
jgi:histidine triad (HIT) family protein